jgi:hypothetical protein
MLELDRVVSPEDGIPACRRCGQARRLIEGDGPPICRMCVMAWSWFARAVTRGEAIAEPSIVAMRHLDHLRPALGCPICARHAAMLRRQASRPKLT